MRGAATALVVVVAVASADEATAQGWTDHPIRPGVTSIKATHFDELRARIAALRAREGLSPVRWTDPVLTLGATTVRRAHLAELRAALGGVYEAREHLPAQVMELREAVEVLENPAPSLEPDYTMLPIEVIGPS